jgi:hypothetical protein
LCRLAIESLIDGALNEGVSAHVLAGLASECEEPRIARMLKAIAADEGRHSAHGWDVLEWCYAQSPLIVGCALRGALRALPRQLKAARDLRAEQGEWERYGLPSKAREARGYGRMREHVAQRVEDLVKTQSSELLKDLKSLTQRAAASPANSLSSL